MKILVTGGAGYIGNLVVEELLKANHKPKIFDKFYWGKNSVKRFKGKIEVVEGDCRNSKDVIYALEDSDAIIHLAGIVGEAACLQNSKAHFSVNLESTRTLLNCCTDPELDLTRDFLFASSCSVYGNMQNIYSEVDEKTSTRPLSAYAQAKLRSERIILNKGKEISHFHPTILRLSTVFGWSERPRLDLVTNNFVYQAWKNNKIAIYGDGNQYRSLIHVRDAAKAFVDVLNSPRFMRDCEIFNVGEKKNNKTINDIAEVVKSFLPKTKIIHLNNKKTDRRDYSINCQKIKNTINWKADWSVEGGIKDLIKKLNTLKLDWESDNYRNNTYQYR